MLDLVVFGAGGMGRELMWQLEETGGYNLLGFADDSSEIQGKTVNGYPVLGGSDWLCSRQEKTAVAIAVANTKVRKKIAEKLKANGNICFPNIIAPDAKISPLVEMGEGCIICFGNIITVNIKIGDFFLSNRSNNIGHDCLIGDYVTLNTMVSVSGNVTIGNGCDIGTGTSIIQGKTIGENTIVGAGAVVIRDLPSDCTAVGVPAAVIKKAQ